jgi:hypothetical protein
MPTDSTWKPPNIGNPTDEIILQLANGISCQNDEAQKMNELMTHQLNHNVEKDQKKKDRFKNPPLRAKVPIVCLRQRPNQKLTEFKEYLRKCCSN